MTELLRGEIELQVDLRNYWRGVRDQGSRSSCLACATSDGHMHCHDLREPLSAEFLFYHSGQFMPGQDISYGLTFDAVEKALKSQGQPRETEWPYLAVAPSPWVPPAVTKRWYGTTSSGSTPTTEIVYAIRCELPVVLGLMLCPGFYNVPPPYLIPSDEVGFGGHAVLGVGLANHADAGQLLLIRNSWGPGWGDHGHAWLPISYLNDKLIGFRTVSPLIP